MDIIAALLALTVIVLTVINQFSENIDYVIMGICVGLTILCLIIIRIAIIICPEEDPFDQEKRLRKEQKNKKKNEND